MAAAHPTHTAVGCKRGHHPSLSEALSVGVISGNQGCVLSGTRPDLREQPADVGHVISGNQGWVLSGTRPDLREQPADVGHLCQPLDHRNFLEFLRTARGDRRAGSGVRGAGAAAGRRASSWAPGVRGAGTAAGRRASSWAPGQACGHTRPLRTRSRYGTWSILRRTSSMRNQVGQKVRCNHECFAMPSAGCFRAT
jgi:hypothetical protein